MTTTPPTQDQTIRIPITWNELLQTPDRQLRRTLGDRYRRAAQAHNDGPPPPATELADLETTIRDLADWARRRRTATPTEEGIRARQQLLTMLNAEETRLNETAQTHYAQMAADTTARIRGEQAAREYVTRLHQERAA